MNYIFSRSGRDLRPLVVELQHLTRRRFVPVGELRPSVPRPVPSAPRELEPHPRRILVSSLFPYRRRAKPIPAFG